MTPVRYSVAIPTMNRPGELRRCLERVLLQSPLPEQILVIDDGRLDEREIAEWLGDERGRLYYRRKSLPGSVASMNLAIDLCRSEWLLFLDDDIYLDPDFMARMAEAVESREFDRAVAGVAGYPVCPGRSANGVRSRVRAAVERFFLLRGRVEGRFLPSSFVTNYEEGRRPAGPYCVEHIPGGLGLWRTAILKENKFDSYYIGYAAGQDQELSYRVSRTYLLICQPLARAVHAKSLSARTNRRTLGEMRLRNQMYFFRRHFSHRPLSWVLFSWAVFGRLLLQFFSAALAADSDARMEEFRGMVAALVHRPRAKGGAI